MYCVGYLCPEEIQEYYKNITHEISHKFGIRDLSKRAPAHITLRYPFEQNDLPDIQNRIDQILLEQKSYRLAINGFGHFGDKTIYLDVNIDDREKFVEKYVRSLRENGKFQNDGFKLHISVARHLERDVFNRVWTYLADLPKPQFNLPFDNLTLFEFKDGFWNVNRVYGIAGK